MSYFETYNKMRQMGEHQRRPTVVRGERATTAASEGPFTDGYVCVGCGQTAVVADRCPSCGAPTVPEDLSGYDLTSVVVSVEEMSRVQGQTVLCSGVALVGAVVLLALSALAGALLTEVGQRVVAGLFVVAALGGGIEVLRWWRRRRSAMRRARAVELRAIGEVGPGVHRVRGRIRVVRPMSDPADVAAIDGPTRSHAGHFCVEDETGSLEVDRQVLTLGDVWGDQGASVRTLRDGDEVEVLGLVVPGAASADSKLDGYRGHRPAMRLIGRPGMPIRICLRRARVRIRVFRPVRVAAAEGARALLKRTSQEGAPREASVEGRRADRDARDGPKP